jgi:glycosyltransferase involved in cell wall biosynthesis
MLSIVIPAYNEEQRIRATISSYNSHLRKELGKGYEIVVVCDGTDKTASIVKGMAAKEKKIRLMSFGQKLGKGGAIMKGFEAAKGSSIGFTDADEAVSPEDFLGMAKKLKEWDCVIASRRAKGAKILAKQPLQRRVLSKIFNILLNLLFGFGISDTQCGAKVMERKAYESVKGKLVSMGFEFDAELLWRIKSAGFSIKEYPIAWRHTKYSKFQTFKKGPGMLFSLISLRLKGT